MAFGRPGLSGAGRADVVFRADIGNFKADVSEARQVYDRSTGQMSDAALRMANAQEKLDRAIHRFGPESRQARQATLEWRREMRALEQQTDRTGRELAQLDSRQAGLRSRTAGLVGGFAGLRSGVGALSLSMLGGAGLTAAFVSSLNAASSLEEEISKSRVTFGGASADVERFATTTAKSIGIARDQALAYASQLGGIFNASGLVRAESAKLGVQFVQLSGDMASFNNSSPVQTLEAIRAGLVGEYEPLRRYQVLLSEARVSQEAMRLSGKRSKDELTEREKALARVNLIMRGTVDQQGDAARTGANYAGQMRRLNAQLRDLQTSAGTLAVPVMTDFVALLNEGTIAANGFAGALRRIGRVEIPGTSSGLGGIAKTIFENVGPYSGLTRARQLRGLLGLFGDDEDESTQQAAGPGGGIGAHRAAGLDVRDRRNRRRRPRRTFEDILLDIAREETRPGTAPELRLHRELAARYQAQIDNLEKRKNLTAKQKQELSRLYGLLRGEQAAIDAVVSENEQGLADARAAAEKKREEAREREAKRMDGILASATRAAERRAKLLKGVPGTRKGMREAALEHVDEVVKGLKKRRDDAEKPLTRAELNAALFGFARDLHGVIGQFGSNIADDPMTGQLATHAHAQTSLLSRQNELLEKLFGTGGFPGTAYTRSALSAAGIGSGL